jgi:hypothetical protein
VLQRGTQEPTCKTGPWGTRVRRSKFEGNPRAQTGVSVLLEF